MYDRAAPFQGFSQGSQLRWTNQGPGSGFIGRVSVLHATSRSGVLCEQEGVSSLEPSNGPNQDQHLIWFVLRDTRMLQCLALVYVRKSNFGCISSVSTGKYLSAFTGHYGIRHSALNNTSTLFVSCDMPCSALLSYMPRRYITVLEPSYPARDLYQPFVFQQPRETHDVDISCGKQVPAFLLSRAHRFSPDRQTDTDSLTHNSPACSAASFARQLAGAFFRELLAAFEYEFACQRPIVVSAVRGGIARDGAVFVVSLQSVEAQAVSAPSIVGLELLAPGAGSVLSTPCWSGGGPQGTGP